MHRGKILDNGELDELIDKHGECDVEELFYKLIAAADKAENRNTLQDVLG